MTGLLLFQAARLIRTPTLRRGRKADRAVTQNPDGTWGATVAIGVRYLYRSRKAARTALVTDTVGQNGRIS